jgi:hypothetical protein
MAPQVLTRDLHLGHRGRVLLRDQQDLNKMVLANLERRHKVRRHGHQIRQPDTSARQRLWLTVWQISIYQQKGKR